MSIDPSHNLNILKNLHSQDQLSVSNHSLAKKDPPAMHKLIGFKFSSFVPGPNLNAAGERELLDIVNTIFSDSIIKYGFDHPEARSLIRQAATHLQDYLQEHGRSDLLQRVQRSLPFFLQQRKTSEASEGYDFIERESNTKRSSLSGPGTAAMASREEVVTKAHLISQLAPFIEAITGDLTDVIHVGDLVCSNAFFKDYERRSYPVFNGVVLMGPFEETLGKIAEALKEVNREDLLSVVTSILSQTSAGHLMGIHLPDLAEHVRETFEPAAYHQATFREYSLVIDKEARTVDVFIEIAGELRSSVDMHTCGSYRFVSRFDLISEYIDSSVILSSRGIEELPKPSEPPRE